MDNLTRLHYLEAMGIDVWVPKASVMESVGGNELTTIETENQIEPGLDQWAILQNEVTECKKCDLCHSPTRTVFGVGNQNADCLLISEAPKEDEAIENKPFIGQAALLLTEMVRAMGMDADKVYITNIVKCSPEENREPHVEETKACYAYLQRQILLIKPKVILVLGRVAAQKLLNTNEPLSKLRGIPHQLAGIPLVVVYHPRYLLRSLLEKRKAWQDLQLVIEQIKKNNNEYMEVS